MSDRYAKPQRRNLRRGLGERAAAAVETAMQLASNVQLQQAVLAKQVLDLEAKIAALHTRADGLAAWCDKNEASFKQLHDAQLTVDEPLPTELQV